MIRVDIIASMLWIRIVGLNPRISDDALCAEPVHMMVTSRKWSLL